MRLKNYRAPTMAEAMGLVRAELGTEALILSTRRVADGVEVTAALEQDGPGQRLPGHAPPLVPRLVPGSHSAASRAAPPRWRPGIDQSAPAWSPAGEAPERAGHRALSWHGIPTDISSRLGDAPLAEALATILHFGTLPLAAGGPPLLFAGPPGAGKTLTVARLATRLVLAGTSPLVITADGRRAGAAEELAAYTRLLGIQLVVASTPASLKRALHHRAVAAPVLIDTTGVSPFAPAQMAAVAALGASIAAIPILILPAGQDPQEAADHAAAFAAAGVRHLVPTRLDMARRLGSIITAAVAGQMTLSEAGTGQGATDGLTRLTPEFLAARLAASPTHVTQGAG
jgi:flagellar biosynthesis protein FlhF